MRTLNESINQSGIKAWPISERRLKKIMVCNVEQGIWNNTDHPVMRTVWQSHALNTINELQLKQQKEIE